MTRPLPRREPSPDHTPGRCSSDPKPSAHRARTTHGEASGRGRAERNRCAWIPLQDLGCLFTLLKVGTVSLELGCARLNSALRRSISARPGSFRATQYSAAPSWRSAASSCRAADRRSRSDAFSNRRTTLFSIHSLRVLKTSACRSSPSPPSRLSFQLATTGNANTQLRTPRCPATLGAEPLGQSDTPPVAGRSQGASPQVAWLIRTLRVDAAHA